MEFRPSSALCNYEVGDIVTVEGTGKRYILISRNAVFARLERWRWYDQLIRDLVSRLRRSERKQTGTPAD